MGPETFCNSLIPRAIITFFDRFPNCFDPKVRTTVVLMAGETSKRAHPVRGSAGKCCLSVPPLSPVFVYHYSECPFRFLTCLLPPDGIVGYVDFRARNEETETITNQFINCNVDIDPFVDLTGYEQPIPVENRPLRPQTWPPPPARGGTRSVSKQQITRIQATSHRQKKGDRGGPLADESEPNATSGVGPPPWRNDTNVIAPDWMGLAWSDPYRLRDRLGITPPHAGLAVSCWGRTVNERYW